MVAPSLASMPRLRYNDMVVMKWMLTLFIQNRKINANLKFKKGDPQMNWGLMYELLEEEARTYKEGDRTSIHRLIQDHLPDLSLDIFINMIQLNKPAILFGARSILTDASDPFHLILDDFFKRFQNTRNVCTAFPDWWLQD